MSADLQSQHVCFGERAAHLRQAMAPAVPKGAVDGNVHPQWPRAKEDLNGLLLARAVRPQTRWGHAEFAASTLATSFHRALLRFLDEESKSKRQSSRFCTWQKKESQSARAQGRRSRGRQRTSRGRKTRKTKEDQTIAKTPNDIAGAQVQDIEQRLVLSPCSYN